MVARWLHTPEVERWWGNPEEQFMLIAGDIDEPAMRQWIVEHDGLAFAYVQAYPVRAWPQAHMRHLPQGAQAIDVFVGIADMIGLGHGGAFVREFADMLMAEGAPVIAVDSAVQNHRGRRAYARAGFVGDEVVQTEAGCVVLMLSEQSSATAIGCSG
jgi:aminoglycoside 6'-N-acetyltransferase